jgi:GNAT superfamily N-acetyltransferase
MPPIMPGHNDRVRRVGVEELSHLPFVRHQLDPALVSSAWRSGEAAVVSGRRLTREGTARVVTGFGPEQELARLLAGVVPDVDVPDRVLVTAPAAVVPSAWPLAEVRQWHWMLSTTVPDPTGAPVAEVTDPDEVTALLDVVAPDSFARPGTPGVEAWLGLRDGDGRLVAVGAALRQPDGTGHLRGIAVHPDARGHGLGHALSAELTLRAMAGTGISSLGVYVDNEPALRIYRRLGYEVVHTFTSGPVSASSITRAAAPSR